MQHFQFVLFFQEKRGAKDICKFLLAQAQHTVDKRGDLRLRPRLLRRRRLHWEALVQLFLNLLLGLAESISGLIDIFDQVFGLRLAL